MSPGGSNPSPSAPGQSHFSATVFFLGPVVRARTARDIAHVGVIRELTPGRTGARRWQNVITGARRTDGRYARVTRVVTGSKRSAREAMAEMEIDLSKRPADALRLAQGMTVGQLLPRWLAHAEEFEGRSPSTMREYRRIAAVVPVPATGAVRLDQLTVRHLEALYRQMLVRGLAHGSVRRVHAVIRRALNQALRWELVNRNVAILASQPREGQHEQCPPSAEVVRG